MTSFLANNLQTENVHRIPVFFQLSKSYVPRFYGPRRIAKLILLSLLLIISCFIISSVSMLFMVYSLPRAPVVHLNSLLVSNFHVLDSRLEANWVANFTIKNPSHRSVFDFKEMKGIVSYKDRIIAENSIEPIYLGMNDQTTMTVNISTTGLKGNQYKLKDRVMEEFRKHKENGVVSFGVGISSIASHTNKVGWANRTQIVALYSRCAGLKVDFNDATRFGRWISTYPYGKLLRSFGFYHFDNPFFHINDRYYKFS